MTIITGCRFRASKAREEYKFQDKYREARNRATGKSLGARERERANVCLTGIAIRCSDCTFET